MLINMQQFSTILLGESYW